MPSTVRFSSSSAMAVTRGSFARRGNGVGGRDGGCTAPEPAVRRHEPRHPLLARPPRRGLPFGGGPWDGGAGARGRGIGRPPPARRGGEAKAGGAPAPPPPPPPPPPRGRRP